MHALVSVELPRAVLRHAAYVFASESLVLQNAVAAAEPFDGDARRSRSRRSIIVLSAVLASLACKSNVNEYIYIHIYIYIYIYSYIYIYIYSYKSNGVQPSLFWIRNLFCLQHQRYWELNISQIPILRH